MMDYEMGWGWGFGWIGMILFWLVPILLVLVAVKYLFAGKSQTGIGPREGNDQALAILEEKYARGGNQSRRVSAKARRLEAELGLNKDKHEISH